MAAAGRTSYYVPNLYDVFASQVPGDGRWAPRQITHLYQTNWYWEILLRQFGDDPLRFRDRPDLH